jgi:hypothetical protein
MMLQWFIIFFLMCLAFLFIDWALKPRKPRRELIKYQRLNEYRITPKFTVGSDVHDRD